jgi:hypothetical protein
MAKAEFVQRMGERPDLIRSGRNLNRPHRVLALGVGVGDPIQIGQPSHDDPLGREAYSDQGQQPGQQGQPDVAEGIQPRP